MQPLKPELETYYQDRILVFKSEPIGNTETIIDQLRTEKINELTSRSKLDLPQWLYFLNCHGLILQMIPLARLLILSHHPPKVDFGCVGENILKHIFLCFPYMGKFYVLYYEYCSLLTVVIPKHVTIML